MKQGDQQEMTWSKWEQIRYTAPLFFRHPIWTIRELWRLLGDGA